MPNRIFKVVMLGLMVAAAILSAPHRVAATDDDGRINQQVWADQHGAVAAYCLDTNGNPAREWSGGIKILDWTPAGTTLALQVTAQQIQEAITAAHTDHQAHLIGTGPNGTYSLEIVPGTPDMFQLNTQPPESRLAMWEGCGPVGNPAGTPPTVAPPACDPKVVECCPGRCS